MNEQYQPQKNDRVRIIYDDDDTWGPGYIVEPGPEQSGWKAYKDKQLRYQTNANFVLIGSEAKVEETVAPSPKDRAARMDYSATRIKVLAEGNPRSPTAKAYTKWSQMVEYMKLNPNASVKEVNDKTLYKIGDFRWDLDRGNVGTEEKSE